MLNQFVANTIESRDFVDITERVQQLVRSTNVEDGI
jgi:thiamine phosphate synthase YjbQ (UPF0047 family)